MNKNASTLSRGRWVPVARFVSSTSRGLAVLGITLACSISAAAQPLADVPASDPQLQSSDPLAPLNSAFREAYTALQGEIVHKTSPVIIQSGDTLVLIKDGIRKQAPALTRRYHELKAVAHVPLALYVMLISRTGTRLDDTQLNRLREYRSLVVKGRDSIEARGFEPGQRDRQLRILRRSLDLIDTTLKNGSAAKADLIQFTRSQKDDVLANAYEAAEDQIVTMDRQFKAWRADMTPEERKQLRVAVSSVHMARVGNIALQYFSVALDEPFEGRFEEEEIKHSDFRLLFAESVFDEKEVLKAVGTHIVDADVGASFFGDEQRMHRDLLSDAAEEILRNKFGRSPAPRR